jgi:endoglucanase
LKSILEEAQYWPYSDELVRIADFTALNIPGSYFIYIPGSDTSRGFSIKENPFEAISDAAVKAYYFNRYSYPLYAEYAGKWSRELGHPDTLVYIHSSAASSKRPEGTTISNPGGWYDAGDYNKYIVNSSITTYTLLLSFELYPDYWRSHDLHIPESGNNLPDIIDETLYNLRWMLTMQDEDGGVYHKLTTKEFAPFVMPSEAKGKDMWCKKQQLLHLILPRSWHMQPVCSKDIRKSYQDFPIVV